MTLDPPASQVAPLPTDLPFRLVSRTIGSGAYASIRKAVPLTQSTPVIAIKFINKPHAFNRGRLKPSQLELEVKLHNYLNKHRNIVEFFTFGQTEQWVWIAMELAENGDLFDKIEADVGVGEDISHVYFTQLMSAVGYMHSKGVAHRDLKPENILVGQNGDLKIADFGLAALFKKGDQIRMCNTVCGSPPYIAPEVVNGKRKKYDVLENGYAPHVADIWGCGVILFTLLVGNTPWDEATPNSYEFLQYMDGKMDDELWQQLAVTSKDSLSLIRGMLKIDPAKRFTLEEIRQHPWMRRANPFLDSDGKTKDPLALATQMMENLKVNFETSAASQRQSQRRTASDAMEIENDAATLDPGYNISATQPETPMNEMAFDWERPTSQPTRSRASASSTQPISHNLADRLMEDPVLSQFTQNPAVPLSLTQMAKRFGDIVPTSPLTQFLSALPAELLISTLEEALNKLRVLTQPVEAEDAVFIRVKTRDGRGQSLNGNVIVSAWGDGVWEVRFVKLKGDPLEWRRFFKNVCAGCRDAILRPDEL